MQWNTTLTQSGVLVHSIHTANQTPYHEVRAQSTWGTTSYATRGDTNVSHKIANGSVSRSMFMSNGSLDNNMDTAFRAINRFALSCVLSRAWLMMGSGYPVFAFARDNALPGSRWWKKMNHYTQTPVNAVWLVMVLSGICGLLGFSEAALSSLAG